MNRELIVSLIHHMPKGPYNPSHCLSIGERLYGHMNENRYYIDGNQVGLFELINALNHADLKDVFLPLAYSDLLHRTIMDDKPPDHCSGPNERAELQHIYNHVREVTRPVYLRYLSGFLATDPDDKNMIQIVRESLDSIKANVSEGIKETYDSLVSSVNWSWRPW